NPYSMPVLQHLILFTKNAADHMVAGAAMRSGTRSLFRQANEACLTTLPGLLQSWFPAGRMIGKEFCIGNLQGDPGKSLKVNILTGRWCDFSTDEAGGDPVSLYAAK